MQKKIVRMLLRVSSNQQLESDGDLSVQRQLVTEYVQSNKDWILDNKEYFEGSNSGYKNSVADRDILQQALLDARKHEYDILVAYKDDRIGRRMWEIGAYVMQLKENGVDIYTVKDGCISPSSDDIMGQMVLALRYGNAQKSSSDTGARVKDTAQKLIQKGKFMGGSAPYGYELVLSGEISKHGRALSRLKIVPKKADIVKYIYELSLNKEFGSTKIARILNEDAYYSTMAPNDVWKAATITSILTNPIYAGYVAYKRRERINGKYHRLDSSDWITAEKPNEDIQIITSELWNRVQDKRKLRSDKFIKKLENKNVTVIKKNDGMLSLIDIAYCGYCGCKLTNGSKYNYWTIKHTGERRTSKIATYKCQNAYNGIPHDKVYQFRADEIEPIVFECIINYIEHLQKNENIFDEIKKNQDIEKQSLYNDLKKLKSELDKIINDIKIMESHIPDAMANNYALNLDELMPVIRTYKEKKENQINIIKDKEQYIKDMNVNSNDWLNLKEKLPTWKEVFLNADTSTKRVLVNKIIERINITKEKINIKFKINIDEFIPKKFGDFSTTPYTLY